MCCINYHRERLKQIHRYIARYPWLQVIIPVNMLNIIDIKVVKCFIDTLTIRDPCIGKLNE